MIDTVDFDKCLKFWLNKSNPPNRYLRKLSHIESVTLQYR